MAPKEVESRVKEKEVILKITGFKLETWSNLLGGKFWEITTNQKGAKRGEPSRRHFSHNAKKKTVSK